MRHVWLAAKNALLLREMASSSSAIAMPESEQHLEEQLQFENQAFVELLSEDGLVIMARGLGLHQLFLKFLKLYSDSHSLVLAINTSSDLERYLVAELLRDGVDHLPKSITNEYGAKERESLYLGGGVLFITSRILVVDLLRGQCPVDKVSGLLVWNAHRVTDSSSEAFILRLFRQSNKSGFIKAFSDSPEPFTNGFCQLERVMRNLYTRNLYLWPRFHATVSASLSRHKPDVVELRQQMTPAMTAIQMAVLDIMKALVAELKAAHPALDTDDMTVENSMSKSFDQMIRLQLDPVWNLLGSKTKQLIHDLRLQRTLLHFLTQYDSVTFYNYLESVRSGGSSFSLSSHSAWVFLDSANTLFVKSRERVFGSSVKQKSLDSQESRLQGAAELEVPMLEESPKWHLLSMVLEEVKNQDACKILIVVNDDRTCYQLRQYLCEGGQKLLKRQYERVVASKQPHKVTEGVQFKPEVAEDADVKPPSKTKPVLKGQKKQLPGEEGSEPATKKMKVEAESKDSVFSPLDDIQSCKPEDDLFLETAMADVMFDVGGSKLQLLHNPSVDDAAFQLVNEPLVVLRAINSSSSTYHLMLLLRQLKPKYVIMYDADVSFVRQVEVFKACHPGMPLRVYFLLYDSSVEEQKYLTALRKEKESFQQLIRERAHMTVPVEREGKFVGSSDVMESAGELGNTRKAGGRQDKSPQTVIVDIREFRSTLPSTLHKKGMEIIPLTLEVGDYILTEDICIERKSVSDLIGSINSGRLYNQAMAMTRHYKRPVLLIEFEGKRAFSLQGSSSLRGEISSQSITSKLVLLTLHFPSLRILWCSSPQATAELFQDLKVGHPQPNPTVAVTVGQDTLDKTQGVTYDAMAQDFLMKLPGINSKNYRVVMDKVSDFQELASLSVNDLNLIMGNDTNALLLWNFLHSETASLK